MSFETPTVALEAVEACLSVLSTRIHKGSEGSGETLDCCNDDCRGDCDPLIRIETGGKNGKDGLVPLHRLTRNRCTDVVMAITITYAECFTSFDGDGPDAATIASTTDQGIGLVESWWDALMRLAGCSPDNQSLRFLSAEDMAPSGGCAGWVLRLEADVCGRPINP